MSDTYQPIPGSDEEYELATTSTPNLSALDRLQLRAPCAGKQARERIATDYCCDDVGDAIEQYCEKDDLLPRPRFWEEAAKVIFKDLTDKDVEEGVDFAEVRRALGNFTNAGNKQLSEQLSGLNAFKSLIENQGAPTPNQNSGA